MNDEWVDTFRTIIHRYNQQRISDPFMVWFREQNQKTSYTINDKVLLVLIDARFDQQTTAEKALENTKRVFHAGALQRPLERNETPSLIPRRMTNAEEWTNLFHEAQPKLHTLASRISKGQHWTAQELLSLMKSPAYKVPYLGIKTSRLAVRWLYELIPELNIDISDYKIPIDKLVYRVASRLGIIDPTTENYSGDGSPADLKIQAFAKQAFPANAWYLDEPLWSTGRQVSRGGHCYPTNPNHAGCIFEDICPKHYPDTDPSERGMETTRKSRRTPKSSQHVAVTSDQRSFKAFIELLNTKKSHGKLSASEWREYRQLWFQRPQDRNELIERLNQL